MPEHTRRKVAQGIKVIVCHHLRLTAGTTGEVHQHGVLVGVYKLRLNKLRSLAPLGLPIAEALGDGFAMVGHGNESLHRRTLGHGLLDLLGHIGVVDTDDGLHAGSRVAVHDVMLGEHVCGGNHDGTDLMERQHDDPPLIPTLEDEHDGIVLANSQREQVRSRLVRLLLELCIGGSDLVALVVGPKDGKLVGRLFSPHVHDVVGEIEILRNDKFQMFIIVLYRLEVGLL